jgi:hypothetical protein
MPQVRHGESVLWRTKHETAPLALHIAFALFGIYQLRFAWDLEIGIWDFSTDWITSHAIAF